MIEPLYKTEPRACKIRYSNRPVKGDVLSSYVAAICSGGRFRAPIRYEEQLLDIVGRALPVGLARDHPAFLRIVNVPSTTQWRLFALYTDRSAIAYLWMYEDCPPWLNIPKHLR